MAIEKNQYPGGRFGATSYIALPIQPIYLANGLNWQCCIADSSKMAPMILIFSITMGADYSFEVKNIKIWVPTFFKHNN